MQKIKPSWMSFLFSAAIIYYLPLVTMTLRFCMFSTYPSQFAGRENGTTNMLPENMFNMLTINNLGLGFQLLLGGLILSSLSISVIFSSSLVEGAVLGYIIRDQPSFILYNVMPHFFFETLGYVLAIGGSLLFSAIMMDWFDGYVKGRSIRANMTEAGGRLKYLAVFFILSVSLIILGAAVESSLLPPS